MEEEEACFDIINKFVKLKMLVLEEIDFSTKTVFLKVLVYNKKGQMFLV